jgi:hypothetical protein
MKTYNHIKIGVLISVLFSLFCFSCNNFFQPPKPEKSTEGKGYVSLSIGGVQVGRTILPQATANDFNGYKLVFVNSHTNEELSLFLTKDTLTQPIPLNAGTYHLTVTAYRDSAPNKPAAEGHREGIKISPNMETPIQLPLKVIIEEEGKGTFRWDITYAAGIAVEKAEMIITRFTNDGEVPAYNNTIAQQSSIELDAGYYRVVIILTKNSGQETAELREILHIYPDMESVFNPVITDSHFSSLIYVTREADDTSEGSLRWAIGQAEKRLNSTIIIDSSVKTITLTNSLYIDYYSASQNANITIEGNGVTITQPSNAQYSLLKVNKDYGITYSLQLTIRRVHFKNGKTKERTPGDGYNALYNGGAIYNSKATLTLESCIFSGNQASYLGGAIYNDGEMDIKGCTFYKNSAWLQGGAIYNTKDGRLSLTGNLFYGNTASPTERFHPVIMNEYNGIVDSHGYNVVDVPFEDNDENCGLSSVEGDQYIPGPTVTQITFKPFTESEARNILTTLPVDYPTIDFYGYPIAKAAGAVQEIEANVCIVTFNTNRYSLKISPVAVKSGDVIEAFANPVLPGNVFWGWYKNEALTEEWQDSSPVTSNITLHAKWETNISGVNLEEKFEYLGTYAESGGEYTFELTGGETISPKTLSYSVSPVTIILKSKSKDAIKTIRLSDPGSMFIIGDQVTLILENITLEGLSNNILSLVIVASDGELIMENKSTITGNTNINDSGDGGGGVYVNDGGRFTMNGGNINGNTISSGDGYGGGVYVGSGGTFEMKGGTISGNEANESGGGVYVYSGTFTMTGGTIGGTTLAEQNTASISGGGVYVTDDGRFTMSGDAIISGNKANGLIGGGGGVYVNYNGIFKMESGTISGNTANVTYGGGGGVHVSCGEFNMISGTISGNETNISGGGVHVSADSIFKMESGTISGNTASTGGGVYVETGTFQMAGGIIYGNDEGSDSNNADGAALSVYSSPWGGGTAEYGTINTDGITFTKKGKLSTTDHTINIVNGDLTAATAGQWAGAIDQIINGGDGISPTDNYYYTINVTEDFAVSPIEDDDATFSWVQNINVTINGYGNTISLDKNSNGSLLYIVQNQTVTLNSLNLQGKGLEAGEENTDSLVNIQGGTLTMKGGTISGNINDNTSSVYGGGVHVNYGTFNMIGGEIKQNTAKGGVGGGVSVEAGPGSNSSSTFTMSNGAKVSGNSATREGGGVYVNEGTFIMEGNTVEVSGNNANIEGGGVFVNGGIFKMKGGEIKHNTAANTGGGVSVDSGIFLISNGTIYGSSENADKRNTVTANNGQGAALYLREENDPTAQRGTFTGMNDAFTPAADGSNLSTTDATISVSGGE